MNETLVLLRSRHSYHIEMESKGGFIENGAFKRRPGETRVYLD